MKLIAKTVRTMPAQNCSLEISMKLGSTPVGFCLVPELTHIAGARRQKLGEYRTLWVDEKVGTLSVSLGDLQIFCANSYLESPSITLPSFTRVRHALVKQQEELMALLRRTYPRLQAKNLRRGPKKSRAKDKVARCPKRRRPR